ncbi:tudor domain-containing 6-like [Penaeus chinensis]|uniref:tudor domain-containing 6-like n=1 Tax=Penaeus chinensis TaxID=139456 RepID=UPI001FB822F6|nr:tudor domain-containing 6-like [Penaeus chinensis]
MAQEMMRSSLQTQKSLPTKVDELNLTETQKTILNRLSNGPRATISNGSLPPEQRTLADKVQVGCEYQGAVISNKGDYKTFTLTLMVETSDSVLDQVLEVLPSIPMDPDFKAVRGSLVAALSRQDGSWYRSYVHDVEEEEYSVCHIDFGDVEKVDKVKALPPGPLTDFPGYSMIGKLHALVRPEYQKELEALIVPDKQITIQVMGKKTSSLKIGIKSENSGKILAYYILRSWYTGLPNHTQQITPTGSVYDVEVNNNSESSFIKGSAAQGTHVATTKQTSDRAADVCRFIPHSVLVSGAANGNSRLNTGSRVGGTQKRLEMGNKTDKPLEHSSPKTMDDTSHAGRATSEGESKQGTGVFTTPKDKLSGITNKFWARDLPSTSVEPEKEYTVLPIWLTEDSMLYVQIVSESTVNAFGKLQFDMNSHCQKGKVPDSITVGEMVCGFVISEEIWYRCEVLAVNDEQITVHLCDFGNQEQIHKENICTFTENFMRDHRFCVKVKVAEVSRNDSIARTKLQALVDGQKQLLMYSKGIEPLEFELFDASGRNVLTEQLHKQDRAEVMVVSDTISAVEVSSGKPSPLGNSEPTEKPVKVKLTSNMQLDIAEQPATANTSSSGCKSDDAHLSVSKVASESATCKIRMYEECKSTSLPISDKVIIIVLEASSPHAISVVPYESLDLYDKLEELSVTMNQYCNSRIGLYRPRVGEMCLAKFSEDDQWYRGVCVGSDVETAAVFFVDYGNHENVPHNRICQIPDSFLELPCIALHCILKGISIEGVKEEAYERLPELLPKNTPVSVTVVSHNKEDGTYVINVPSVVNSLVSEGLVCRES